MKVFVGGAFQGKKKAAMEKTGLCETDFLDGETCTKEELLTGKAVNHFHSYIRRALKAEREEALDAFVQELFQKNPDIVIVSTELGYGIVPIDAFEREYREETGRICCLLAEKSEEVWRVCCGLGQRLK